MEKGGGAGGRKEEQKGGNEPFISSAQRCRTRWLNSSRTCASWLADSGSGFLEGIARFSSFTSPPSLPPLLPPAEGIEGC